MENNKASEVQTFEFKTNINCSGCVAKVTPALTEANGILHWKVDTTLKDKILTVQSNGISQTAIVQKVQSAGFTIENIEKNKL